MDIAFLFKYMPMYLQAMLLTVKIAFLGILLSILIGLICNIIRIFCGKALSALVNSYIELSRNTPLLVQLFFLYYGLPKLGIVLSSSRCAIIGLSFLGGSYMAEALYTGFAGIEKIQEESALSLGLSPIQVFIYVILPQVISNSIASIWANIIFLIKETSVFSIVALADLMFVAKDLIGMYSKTDESLLLLVISYLIIILPISLIGKLVERRLRFAEFGS